VIPMSSEDRRKVLIVTGSRAEYDILFPVVDALQSRGDVEAGFAVTGTHLSPFHGLTVTEVRGDGMPVWAEIPNLLATDDLGTRPRALGLLVGGLVAVLETRRPDIVLACGDREDVLAAAIASAYMNTVYAHYCAGDEAFDGNIDNAVRHATSKLAHVLLVTRPEHKVLLEASGEDPRRIHVVGNSGLDRIVATPRLSLKQLQERLPYPLPDAPRALVIHHSTSSTVNEAADEVTILLSALASAGVNALVSYPNCDAGNIAIRKVLDEHADRGQIRTHHNLDRTTFVNLVRVCNVIVGNSSMGILEAPTFGIPAVNVGCRQRGRLAGPHVLWCDPDVEQIERAVRRACDPGFRRGLPVENAYGDGHAGPRIAELVANLPLTDEIRFKRFAGLKGAFAS
jgi:GDP/UDP-N,N'-diacetylbacillosamine 2-epimerase (hydrolysing)